MNTALWWNHGRTSSRLACIAVAALAYSCGNTSQDLPHGSGGTGGAAAGGATETGGTSGAAATGGSGVGGMGTGGGAGAGGMGTGGTGGAGATGGTGGVAGSGGDGCSAELVECDAGCVDTMTDRSHCGDCGNPCDLGMVCQEGECVTPEPIRLLANDGETGDQFGYSVALSGDTALVGAPGDGSGSVYVFIRSGSTWTEQQKLVPSDDPDESFGTSVAIDEDTAVIGGCQNPGGRSQGSAYVFVRAGSTWTEQQKLAEGDYSFGVSVAVSGEAAVVGAPFDSNSGSGHVFLQAGSTWTEQQPLLPSDGPESDEFGYSVAASGNTTLVGAHRSNGVVSEAGAAYVFVRMGSMLVEQQKLVAADGSVSDQLGSAVALSGDTAVVGTRWGGDSGTAYVFRRSGSMWSEEQKLLPSDGAETDFFFGRDAVAASNDVALVGAPGNGSVYVFLRSGSSWSEERKLVAPNGASLGASVALSGDTTFAGAPGDAFDKGSVYVFELGLQ